MTKTEKTVLYSLIFFLAIGIGVRIYRNHYSQINLEARENPEILKKKSSTIPKIGKHLMSLKENGIPIVEINSASADDFATLPGIGKKTGQKIVDFRNINGSFKEKTDLLKVKEIGIRLYLKLEPYLIVENNP